MLSESVTHRILLTQSTYIRRVQSCAWFLPKYWPPIPLSTQRVCPPPVPKAGGTHSPGGEEGGGSIFWKTPAIGLASYSLISLRIIQKEKKLRGVHSALPLAVCRPKSTVCSCDYVHKIYRVCLDILWRRQIRKLNRPCSLTHCTLHTPDIHVIYFLMRSPRVDPS